MSRAIDDLTPECQEVFYRFRDAAADAGIFFLVTCTRRTRDEQAALYAIGRTSPGRIVTHARPGESVHESGNAFDIVPLHGKMPLWDAKAPEWIQLGAIGESLGLTWGGRWKMRDMPHFQLDVEKK